MHLMKLSLELPLSCQIDRSANSYLTIDAMPMSSWLPNTLQYNLHTELEQINLGNNDSLFNIIHGGQKLQTLEVSMAALKSDYVPHIFNLFLRISLSHAIQAL